MFEQAFLYHLLHIPLHRGVSWTEQACPQLFSALSPPPQGILHWSLQKISQMQGGKYDFPLKSTHSVPTQEAPEDFQADC